MLADGQWRWNDGALMGHTLVTALIFDN
jgi:hypothetical protein